VVAFEREAVDEVLEVGEGLALAADEAAGVPGADIQQEAFLQVHFVNGGFKTEELKHFLEGSFGIG
jgi:hypothetical protein